MADVGTIYVKIAADTEQLLAGVNQINQKLDTMAGAVRGPTEGFTRLQTSIISLNQGIAVVERLASSAGSAISTFANLADTSSTLAARVRLVTTSQADFATVQEKLFAISQQAGASIESTTELYVRMSRATANAGVSQSDLLKVTETVNKALVISGATAEESSAGLVQLSQALASGTLRGDELRSVLEQMPAVTKILTDSLGVSVGKLRELGEQGALTTDVIIKALIRGGAEVDRQFSAMPPTVARAFQQIENETLRVVGRIDEATGASHALAGAISDIAKSAEQSLPAAIASAQSFASAIIDNRSAIVGTLSLIAESITAIVIAGAGLKAIPAVLSLIASNPAMAAVTAAAVAAKALSGNIDDLHRTIQAGSADAQVFQDLAAAIEIAHSRGYELSQQQREMILSGQGVHAALTAVSGSANEAAQATRNLADGAKAGAAGMSELQKASEQKVLADLAVKLAEVDSKARLLGTGATDTAGQLKAMEAAFDALNTASQGKATPAMEALAAQIKALETKAASSKGGVDALKGAIDSLKSKNIDINVRQHFTSDGGGGGGGGYLGDRSMADFVQTDPAGARAHNQIMDDVARFRAPGGTFGSGGIGASFAPIDSVSANTSQPAWDTGVGSSAALVDDAIAAGQLKISGPTFEPQIVMSPAVPFREGIANMRGMVSDFASNVPALTFAGKFDPTAAIKAFGTQYAAKYQPAFDVIAQGGAADPAEIKKQLADLALVEANYRGTLESLSRAGAALGGPPRTGDSRYRDIGYQASQVQQLQRNLERLLATIESQRNAQAQWASAAERGAAAAERSATATERLATDGVFGGGRFATVVETTVRQATGDRSFYIGRTGGRG